MAYRTLKLDMEEKRARQEQLLFYALEMKSRRQTEKRKILKFLSWLYEATSDYGQRIFLPLAWLVYLFLFFTFFYAALFQRTDLDLDAASILPQSLHFSIKQIIRPFGVFGSLSNSGIWGKIPPSSLLSLPLIYRGHASIHFKSRASAPERPRGALELQDRVKQAGLMRDGPPRGFFPKPGRLL